MRILWGMALACVAAACPEPPPEPPPPVNPQAVFEASCKAYGAAWCARRDACAVGRDRAEQGESCVAAFEQGCMRMRAVAPGRGFDAFDEGAAAACIAAMPAVECALFDQRVVDLESCRLAFAADVEVASACLVDADCRGGYCARTRDGCGRCEARMVPGESCADFPCASGSVCVRDLCRPRRAEGAACEQDVECGPGLFCHLERRQCEAQRGEDAPCADDQGIRDCAEHLFCADRVCTAAIERSEGNPCAQEGSVCNPGTWCDGQFCRAWLPEGGNCAEDVSCGPQGACLDNVCRARGAVGAACERDRSCWPGLACLGGACTALEVCP